MTSATRTRGKYQVTALRQAQRDLTRSRIRDAARTLFHEHHYDSTTIDQIASSAGLTRSTFYLHYKDKAEILADIIADYLPRAKARMETIPGPFPTLQQLQRWTEKVAEFLAEERVPLAIILDVGETRISSAALGELMNEVLLALGKNNPAFRRSAAPDADLVLRARASSLVTQLTFACRVYADKKWAHALRRVAAESFHEFLSRFNGPAEEG
jgi:AcrR family transcriptional regulator